MKWEKYWTRDYTYHYIELCLRCIGKLVNNLIFVRKGENFVLYSTKEEKDLFQKANHKLFLKNPYGFIQNTLDVSKKFCEFTEEISKKDIAKLSNKELLENLKEYYRLWIEFTIYVWKIWNLNETYAKFVSDYISNKAVQLDVEGKLPKYLEYISVPAKKSSILLLDDEIKKGNSDIDRLFKEYVWMPWGDLHAIPWTRDDVVKYVENHKPPDNVVIPFSQIKEELELNEKEVEMIDLNRQVTYLKDYRDEVRRKTVYLVHFLYKEISKRFGIDYNELMYYSTPELFEGKRLSSEDLEKRKGDIVAVIKDGKFVVHSDVDEFLDKMGFVAEDYSQIKEIKGTVASQGKVKGLVKIIKLDKDIEKVQKGDIMIAVTTHPDYTLKMQIASAIVTDEGGITCHAAIVSRELGIPCIVGTETGTKILKDGDLVEVDANKGIVKKIK